MNATNHAKSLAFAACLISAALLCAQSRSRQPQPEFIREGRQLIRQGKLDEALTLYRQQLKKTPASPAANTAAGVVLDLMGRGDEARKYFAQAIGGAKDPRAKADAQRAMAMSYAFEGDCGNTVKFEQQVFNHYAALKNFYQQGEIADEAARVCIDSGDLDAAERWYRTGHDAGLKEPGIKPDRVALWNYRWEHAQARIAARRGNKIEAEKHAAAAKELLDQNPEMAKGQAVFFPYLKGYVAFYSGDYQAALDDLRQANQHDPFIQTLLGQTYEKLGNKDTASEYYRQASVTTAHNPPAAYAHRFASAKLGSP